MKSRKGYGNQDDSAEEGPDLGKVELSHADPELGVNWLSNDEVEGALAHVIRYFENRCREKVIERADYVERRTEDLGFASIPSGNCFDIGVDNEQDDEEKAEPDGVLEHLGDEVNAELELTRERAFEKRSVNPPVVSHRFEAYFESWSF